MRIRLNRDWTDRLLGWPEAGMGYQRFRVRLKDGRCIDNVIALNAEFIEVPAGTGELDSSDITDVEPMPAE